MSTDSWLDRWLPRIHARAVAAPVLELGCGRGEDTFTLTHAGYRVVALDVSARSLDEAKIRVPQAEFHCQDIRAPFPVQAASVGVVLASLSLHYFAWSDTLALVRRVRETLRPGGVLLCRLNSTHDHHYGASGHPRIDENFYCVHGESKRFFDRVSIDALFSAGWRSLSVEEHVIHRYAHPKVIWEVILERDG
jgi:SAM-dependent methyltransferase